MGPTIEDLYKRYSEWLASLFSALLSASDANEAVNDVFAALHLDWDELEGMDENEVHSRLSAQAYDELQRRLGKAPEVVLHLIDATAMAQALIEPNEDGETFIDGWVLYNVLQAERERRDPGQMLTEAILSRDRPERVDMELIAGATKDNAAILSAFMLQARSAQHLGISLGQLLTPFSQATLLAPDGAPVDSRTADEIALSARSVSLEMLELLAATPEQLHNLTPRQFEEVVAELFAKQGYEVNLTAASQDGGADIYVVDNTSIGSFLYVVECKKNRPDRPVGVGIVRQLFGVVQATRATAGILATTSYFTAGAKELQQELQYQLSLRDFAALKSWLRR